ncbi:DUF342 domain-containing protein [Bacillus sp. FJAT-45037]|uniref:DUF342 domain-containing protein n=1 Tax=Bacillus sp. FJAT-45037 TaxID=2011007 RepID=UPI000C23F69F|nr:FapA family protein [Bacillus sp. FJAT-45037]
MIELERYFTIQISNSKMEASIVQLERLKEDEHFSAEEFKSWIHEHGINSGIIEEVVDAISNDQEVKDPVIFAQGIPPTTGKDAYLKISFLDEKETNNDGEPTSINLRQFLEIDSVFAHNKIAEKVSATKGQNGFNVLGEELIAKSGKDFVLRAGKNTRVNLEEQSVYSLIDGQVSIEEKKIHVFPVYEVKGDLDMKTGNVTFVGSVVVNGNVPNGFEIKADGDIRVRGTVEGARLIAGGSIFVGAGIVGQKRSYIKAEENIHTSFINEGDVEAGGNLEVVQAILHSKCKAAQSIVCTRGKGNIVGGVLSAGVGIMAKEIGNDMQTKTSLYIGVNEQMLKKQKEALATHQKALEDIDKLGKLLKVYLLKQQQQPLVGKEKIMMLRVKHSLQAAKNLLDSSEETVRHLNESIDSKESGYVLAEREIFPNVDVHFGKYRRKIATKYQYAKIELVDSEIKVTTI